MEGPRERLTPVAFDRYFFDPEQRRLLRNGKPVALQGKAFDLLSVLVARRGAAVSREELYEQLWPNGVVEDGNLTQSVYLLRRALDPSGTGRAFVDTLPRYGYRFAKPLADFRPRPPPVPSLSRQLVLGAVLAAAGVVLLLGGSAVQSTSVPLGPQAAISYSLGLYHLNLRGAVNLRHSVAYFTETVREAPQSALGYAGLASAYALEAEFEKDGSSPFKAYVALAKRYRDRALARDATNAEAHAVAAFLAYRFDGDSALAEREFRRTFAADPRSAAAHHWHAILLFSQGAIGAAVAEWELAHRLDPTSEVISRWLGRAYTYQRRPGDAIRAFSETLTIQPSDAPALLGLASAQEQLGNLRDALQTLQAVRRRMPYESAYVIPDEARVGFLLRHDARDRRTIVHIDRLVAQRRLDAVEAALCYVALGLRDRAIAVLRTARPMSPIAASMAKFDPRFDAIRTDARFQRLFE
jgi:DNA-binding winged helix-turn-helix (wHTH) protein/tetratricopeptide (TPR) repeat protein